MDDYTEKTRRWLDKRFNLYSNDVYLPNQPIYGLSKLRERQEEYVRSIHILVRVNRLNFNSFVDVGCAEGYMAAIVCGLYGSRVFGAELSGVALKRAREIYDLDGFASDVHSLPFKDDAFDLVLCSEVLEHLPDPEKAVSELLRIAKDALLITTPKARSKQEQKRHFENLDPQEPHAHINYFTQDEMKRLLPGGSFIESAVHPFAARLQRLIAEDNEPEGFRQDFYRFIAESSHLSQESLHGLKKTLIESYESPYPWARFFGARTVGLLLKLDLLLSKIQPSLCRNFIASVVKDNSIIGKPKYSTAYLTDYLLKSHSVPFLCRKNEEGEEDDVASTTASRTGSLTIPLEEGKKN